MTTSNKPTTGFWVIAVIALLWNLWGVFAYLGQTVLLTDEVKALMPAEQVALIESTPSWLNIVFAVATVGGALASLLLLMRRKLAVPLFALSLIAVIIQMGYSWFATDAAEIYGAVQGYVLPTIVILFGLFLYMYSKKCAGKGWLR